MKESVVDTILRNEHDIMSLNGITGLEPPLWDAGTGLLLKYMTLLERVSYRNWEYAHPDKPHHRGELFRRVVCDDDWTLAFPGESAAMIERAIDPHTLTAVFGLATAMFHGKPNRPLTPPPRRTDA